MVEEVEAVIEDFAVTLDQPVRVVGVQGGGPENVQKEHEGESEDDPKSEKTL